MIEDLNNIYYVIGLAKELLIVVESAVRSPDYQRIREDRRVIKNAEKSYAKIAEKLK